MRSSQARWISAPQAQEIVVENAIPVANKEVDKLIKHIRAAAKDSLEQTQLQIRHRLSVHSLRIMGYDVQIDEETSKRYPDTYTVWWGGLKPEERP